MIHSNFFVDELRNNLNLYLDKSCNTINLTTLAESYIDQFYITDTKKIELVFEGVIDWFESWSGKSRFNN